MWPAGDQSQDTWVIKGQETRLGFTMESGLRQAWLQPAEPMASPPPHTAQK